MGDPLATPEVQEELRKLDGILPESVNRRAFLKSTIATAGAGLLAGCTGDDNQSGQTTEPDQNTDPNNNQDQSGTPDDGIIKKQLTFQTTWKALPSLGSPHIAENEGFWLDAGIAPANTVPGGGASTAKLVGTGQRKIGIESILNIVRGVPEGLELTLYGTDRIRSTWALIYRTDSMDNAEDLANKRVVYQSPDAEAIWPYFAELAGAPDSVSSGFASETSAAGLLDQKRTDATFGTVNDFEGLQENTGPELDFKTLYSYQPLIGYAQVVNPGWLSESNNLEYTTRLLSGFSEAAKWIHLNPEKMVEVMRQDINPALQASSKSSLVGEVKGGLIATNLTDGVKNNGFSYIDQDLVSTSIDAFAEAFDISDAPSASDIVNTDIQDNAELAVPTSDEWNQIKENGQPYADKFTSD